MAYVSEAGLRWALERLDEWRRGRPRRFTQTLFRFLILKHLGVRPARSSRQVGTSDFREVCRKFLQVSFGDAEPYYFVPFSGDYQRAVENADWAVGTMWTRSDVWNGKIVHFDSPQQNKRTYRFLPNYLGLLAKPLKGARIPALPLAIFLFRRPSETAESVPRSAADYEQTLRKVFNLSTSEASELLDTGESAPANAFGREELSRDDVLRVLTEMFGPPGAPEDEAGSGEAEGGQGSSIFGTVAWDTDVDEEAECGLRGLRRQMQQAVAALKSGKHVIFMGPPGTGKTALANCLCKTLGIPYDVVTATSDWTTYDTIGGYLPDPTLKKDGSEPLNFIPAVVTQSWLDGRWLVIDEINRADIDKAFGELFTLFSGNSVRLPFRRREGDKLLPVLLGAGADDTTFAIRVPPDWRLIGTMNTFDKASLYQMSFAFMRRFAFIDLPVPDTEDYRTIIRDAATGTPAGSRGDDVLRLLESTFAPDSGKGLDGLGLAVGPAIAIDAVRYAKERLSKDSVVDPWTIVLEALEMYLYPQFEGKDARHLELIEVIGSVLELPSLVKEATSRRLAVWTGFEAPSA